VNPGGGSAPSAPPPKSLEPERPSRDGPLPRAAAHWPPWVAAGATVLAAVIRLRHLGVQPLWLDEYYSALLAARPASIIIGNPDGEAPLHGLLLHAVTLVGGASDAWLRLPSVVAGTLAVPVLYLVGRALDDRPVAALAALLLAVHPLAVWYSQEARVYSLLALCGLASTLALASVLRDGRRGAAMLYALLAGVGFGLHYYFVFVLAAHACMAAWDALRTPQHRSLWAATALASAAAMAVWAPAFVADAGSQASQDVASRFSWFALPYSGLTLVGGLSLGPPLRALHPSVRYGGGALAAVVPHLPSTVAAFAVLAGLLALAATRPWDRRRVVTWLLAATPVLGAWLASAVLVGFRARYVLPALPFVVLLVAGTIRTRWLPLSVVLIGAFMALELRALAQIDAPDYAREDTRAAAMWVHARQAAGPVLLLGEGAEPFARYADPHDDVRVLERAELPELSAVSELFLVSSRPWTIDPEDRVRRALEADFSVREEAAFAGVDVRRYIRRAAGG